MLTKGAIMLYAVKFRKDGKKAKVRDWAYKEEADAIARLDTAEKDWKETLLSSQELAQFRSGDASYVPFNRAVSIHRALWALYVETDLGEKLHWTIEEINSGK